MSRFSEAKSSGFVLAAVLAGDRELALVQAHLHPDELVRLRAGSAQREGDRAALIARLLTYVRPPLTQLPAELPARLRALLARRLPAPEARKLLAGAPRMRAGFEPETELGPRLLRIGRRSCAPSSQPPAASERA
ncbi:MAG: hypothetical protein JWN04_1172 [Myxococcaceae bacterium]|nr:hypothetical protein [Myxococcaceae bacterium]